MMKNVPLNQEAVKTTWPLLDLAFLPKPLASPLPNAQARSSRPTGGGLTREPLPPPSLLRAGAVAAAAHLSGTVSSACLQGLGEHRAVSHHL